MTESTSLEEHLTIFKEIVSNLETMEVRYNEEDLGLILLCSLPSSYMTFRDTILYSHDTLTLDDVYNSLYSKEKMKQLVVGFEAQREGLVVWRRTQKRNSGGDARGRSKSKNRDKVYNYYKKKGHIKSECYKLQNKNKRVAANQKRKQSDNSGEASVAEDDYSDGELLVISDGSSKPCEDWILDPWFIRYNWNWSSCAWQKV